MRRVAVGLIICFAIVLGFSGRAQVAHARPNASPSSPFLVTRSGNTYTAASQSTASSYTGTLKFVMESAVIELNSGGGGIVNFTAGTFDFGSQYFKVDEQHNITYQGAGRDATILQNSTSAAADTEVFNFGGAFNVTIRDLTVSAGGPVRLTSDAIDLDKGNDSLVENVKIIASRGRGIVFDGKNIANGVSWTSANNIVRNCVIDGMPGDGIEFLASTNNLVEGCVITNTGYHGIQATKSSTQTSGQKNKKSSDNIIRNNIIDNAGRDGINVNSSDRNRIEGNQITNSGNVASGSGIRIQSSDSITCDDNIVENNVATDNQATKTQRYGLNIAHALCNRTVVGSTNNFNGNLTKPINDLGTNTQYAADTTPPSVPQNLVATAINHARIDLSWTASTDNIAVGSYTIRRGGSFLATVGGATTTYSDTTVQPSTSYSYTVEALDTATPPNPSGQSSAANATTPATPPVFTVTPKADAYVNESSPGTNYGNATTLRADASPVNRSYLRFTVQAGGGSVTRATLRVFANTASSIGHSASGVADITWGETSINFTNAPAVGSVINSSGPFSAGTWAEVDVTPYVTGNGTYTLALTTTTSTAITYSSRQGGNAPELVVETGAPDTQPPTVPGNVTATAINSARVDVSWSASLDNVGVHHYTIRRGGQFLAEVGGGVTSYSDTAVQPLTTYSYTVEAVDAATNPSGQSTPPAIAMTPAPPGPDTTPPSVPGNVTASAITYARIDLSWTASTDNVAVDHYTIRRGGAFLADVAVGTTTYSDTTVLPSTTYSYTVQAVDTASPPNASGQSTPPASATTPAAPSSFTFTPDVDAYVNEASASTNYGNATTLRVDGSPLVRSYLRFTVQGVVGTVSQVTLRVFANSASSTGHEARGVSDISWGEGTINFTNAPAFGSVINSTSAFSAGTWVDVNVTSYVTGNGTYSLALTGPGSTAISYASSETANAPQLIVQVT
jgi:parallel beta-helix repeat protein